MKRRLFCIFLLLVMVANLGISVPVTALSTTEKYVTTTGLDTNSGTNASPWRTITYAVANVSAGGTVNVAAGTYNESFTITKNLKLSGAGADSVTINGGGTGKVVTIAYNNVTVSGFTITGSGANPLENCGICLYGVSGCTISNNIVKDNNGVGIALVDSDQNTISNNTVTNNVLSGIALQYSNSNTITGNTCTGNKQVAGNYGYGIFADSKDLNEDTEITTNEQSASNSFTSNKASSNAGDGLYLGERCDSNTITSNEFKDNGNDGIYAWKSSTNTISQNTITGNTAEGLQFMASQTNQITKNTISGNGQGIWIRSGHIYTSGSWIDWKSNDCSISENTIKTNTNAGINADDVDNLTIKDNQITGNNKGINFLKVTNSDIQQNLIKDNSEGIFLAESSSIDISGNDILSNLTLTSGVHLEASAGEDIVLNNNNIVANNYGVYNLSSNMVDATSNWWGDNSGPLGPGQYASGLGDQITANVDAYPWLQTVSEVNPFEKVETATENGNASIVTDNGAVTDFAAIDEADLPEEGKPPFSYPYGFFTFQTIGFTGDSVVLTLTFDFDIPKNSKWIKYFDGNYYVLDIGDDDGDNVITIELHDGVIGEDDDGIVNGVIVDDGAPGLLPIGVGGEVQSVNPVQRYLPWLVVTLLAVALAAVAFRRKLVSRR